MSIGIDNSIPDQRAGGGARGGVESGHDGSLAGQATSFLIGTPSGLKKKLLVRQGSAKYYVVVQGWSTVP
ncbi:hypothetical protein RJ55_08155 [Drechmeria coniospora]|nr:hypothetical protein RJ55_08155 [Drechmeria coniospora]